MSRPSRDETRLSNYSCRIFYHPSGPRRAALGLIRTSQYAHPQSVSVVLGWAGKGRQGEGKRRKRGGKRGENRVRGVFKSHMRNGD